MKNKLNKNFWNKHGHVVIIYVFLVALIATVTKGRVVVVTANTGV